MARGRAGRDGWQGNPDDEHVVDEERMPAVIHRSPRYGRFLLIGIFGGVLVAFLFVAFGNPGGPASESLGGAFRVFGVLSVVFGAIGLLIAALTVIAVDAVISRRERTTQAQRDTTLVDDLRRPVTDDPPTP
jgi:protein-S-isoprenylcysteine O-methyltransferase Ste14